MDTISLGGILAWAMESYEKGRHHPGRHVRDRSDLGQRRRRGGDGEENRRACTGPGVPARRGLQDRLRAHGPGVRGLGAADEGPGNRRSQLARPVHLRPELLHWVASGPNHERGNSQHIWVGHVMLPEWGIDHVENAERWSWEKASDRNAKFHDYCNVINSAVHCKFQEFAELHPDRPAGHHQQLHRAATGAQEDMRRCGERITNLQKLLNIRYGWKTGDDFKYPKRFMEPVSEGAGGRQDPGGAGRRHSSIITVTAGGMTGDATPTASKLKELGAVDSVCSRLFNLSNT
ncbi:MAG: aldehyde ferredoxin oxidoreductase C-terminal domain-containing protein [Chromatiales bacterium]|nr:aldehyde ferredoxin oxidoreductase C-terminal domain-containing protein [Chromatiales bacterium]